MPDDLLKATQVISTNGAVVSPNGVVIAPAGAPVDPTAPPAPLFTHAGTVIHGEKIGRTIGYPTLNIDPVPEHKGLAKGVYAGTCLLGDIEYDCIVYFGPRMIFNETKDCFEAYVYNFNQEVYDQKAYFTIWKFLRPPIPFASLPEMQAQLEQDKVDGENLLKELHAQAS